jgi:hypothetical protein
MELGTQSAGLNFQGFSKGLGHSVSLWPMMPQFQHVLDPADAAIRSLLVGKPEGAAEDLVEGREVGFHFWAPPAGVIKATKS